MSQKLFVYRTVPKLVKLAELDQLVVGLESVMCIDGVLNKLWICCVIDVLFDVELCWLFFSSVVVFPIYELG